jgi:AP2 domain
MYDIINVSQFSGDFLFQNKDPSICRAPVTVTSTGKQIGGFLLERKIMKEIQLTQGKVTLVDDDMYEFLSQWKWYAHCNKKNKKYYAQRHQRTLLGEKTILMHRVIIDAPNGIEVDHIDGDTLRNLRENLRHATTAQNQHNREKLLNNTSGYKGVAWHKRDKKWRVDITFNRKTFHIGYFEDKEEAARAYDEAAKKYHGEFARLNFPNG